MIHTPCHDPMILVVSENHSSNFSVQEIYSEGGRKFAFQNAAPMGCLPMSKSRFSHDGQCVDLLLQLTAEYNRMLSVLLHGLAQRVHGFKYSIFDYYNALLDRIKNPTHHGKHRNLEK